MNNYFSKWIKPKKYKPSPGAGIVIGLFCFIWSGLSVHIGTFEVIDYYLEIGKVTQTIETNAIGFWFTLFMVVAFGLLFFISDIFGFIYGHERVFNTINNKKLNNPDKAKTHITSRSSGTRR